MPPGSPMDADQFRKVVLDNFDMSLGAGLSKVTGKIFRIGHLGDTNDLTIMGALSGVEMALDVANIPHKKGGAQAAIDYLAKAAKEPMRTAAE
jgi:alanine-glyoxylate transaminase/serine-glyoxylate transaminase/serine-pyruvate transaminase